MASERAHDRVRRFYFWQMSAGWIPLANLRTRRGRLYLRVYGWLHSAIVQLLLRLP